LSFAIDAVSFGGTMSRTTRPQADDSTEQAPAPAKPGKAPAKAPAKAAEPKAPAKTAKAKAPEKAEKAPEKAEKAPAKAEKAPAKAAKEPAKAEKVAKAEKAPAKAEKGAKAEKAPAKPEKADKSKADGAAGKKAAKTARTAKAKKPREDADEDDGDGDGDGAAVKGNGKSLVIVESPAKAKTIGKYLGRGYVVKASVGHVMDLPPSKLGVDVEHDFKPTYEVMKGKATVLKEITAAAKRASKIFLAPDPDREGEAIAWHIAEQIREKNKPMQRVVFNEITKKAVQEAFNHPRALDQNLFESQQARRIVDRLVGYQISPILWLKVRRGLSAGRVQSVAVRIVVEREREIQKFVPQEYWSITARLAGLLERNKAPEFDAKLWRMNGEKVEIADGETANKLVAEISAASLKVIDVQKKERRRNAPAPFTTSKLQQEASKRLRFSPKRTMGLAQSLYEGVDLGETGTTGLITYMRTDSTRVSNEALTEVRSLIGTKYGPASLPAEPNAFKSKKGAQDAHEAVRPTSVALEPEQLRPFLDKDQLALYTLIWQRFVASQMVPAVYDATTVDIEAGKHVLRANGSILKESGFLSVYQESKDEDTAPAEGEDDTERTLPNLEVGDALERRGITPEQHFTQPPPRFSEASLVKELEEKGIGRPSTYASILATIQARDYVKRDEAGRLRPTQLGFLVTDLLVQNFPEILNVEFTADLEEKLDAVEDGTVEWLGLMKKFYGPFEKKLEEAKVLMRDVKAEATPTEHKCEKCGSVMVIKWGRMGEFLACSGYPECKNTKDFKRRDDGTIEVVEQEPTGEKCPNCGADMFVKRGRFGRFIACSRYPECKTTQAFTFGVHCPKCKEGLLGEKKSRRGKYFYGCTKYPNCDYVSWYKPLNEPCPQCNHPFLTERWTKRTGVYKACPNKECGYKLVPEEPVGDQPELGGPSDI
jgi:DNA topoisomerase-1